MISLFKPYWKQYIPYDWSISKNESEYFPYDEFVKICEHAHL